MFLNSYTKNHIGSNADATMLDPFVEAPNKSVSFVVEEKTQVMDSDASNNVQLDAFNVEETSLSITTIVEEEKVTTLDSTNINETAEVGIQPLSEGNR